MSRFFSWSIGIGFGLGMMGLCGNARATEAVAGNHTSAALGEYVVIAWNDLGMHCMNRDFSNLCVLPPFNNLWAVVVHRGDPPQLVSQGVTLTYSFPANTDSAGKVNFWTYEQALFGGSALPPNIGLTGHGLSGSLEWNGTAWEASGVPITPFEDANPTVEQPYQFAQIVLRDASNNVLDTTTFVVPVSTEIHCDDCHGTSADIDILTKHDEDNQTQLMSQRPVLCANCHASNALGKPGVPGLPNLSRAVHGFHGVEVGASIGCYHCHPGRQTQCLRGAMFIHGKSCVDCHGNVLQVASATRQPWIDEPRCATCHPAFPEETGKLYRNSVGHGGVYCEAYHNSTHAELPTVQPRDAVQVERLQGTSSYIRNCHVCHMSQPLGPGPHGLVIASADTVWMFY